LAAEQQAVEFVPDAVTGRGRHAGAGGEAFEDAAQFPVVPGHHAERGDGDDGPRLLTISPTTTAAPRMAAS
jgi:hypothetical protein